LFTWEKSYFPRATPGGNVTISWVSKSSYLPYAREMNVVFPQAYVLVNSAKLNILAVFVYKIIISEHLWSYLYSAKSWEFRIRKIRYCWEGNMILLRGKYDVLINVTWDCFDQSNFYISWINILEWNNIICCGNKIIYWGNKIICCGNKISFLWEQINKFWEQDIILGEQHFVFSHGLNHPPYIYVMLINMFF
jgi:hypothetical protein